MNTFPKSSCSRKAFLTSLLSVPILSTGSYHRKKGPAQEGQPKLSLNAYSFNAQLLDGKMNLNEVLQFCAENDLAAADLTAYYFPTYPRVAADADLYNIKREAFRLGVEISGTGVRNDFTEADRKKRQASVQLVKNWIDAAEKMGAQTVRIFSGNQAPKGYTRKEILTWMIDDIGECIDYGKSHGVVIALQNHDDFIKTADDIIEIMEAVKSDWFGLMLDIGSLRSGDPYEEISRTVKYAITWQIKEKVYVNGAEQDVDADKLVNIIKAAGYRGYLPLETLGAGDPKKKLSALLRKFQRAFSHP